MKHREDIWGRDEALRGRPFLYLNGSLFYGEPGEHHGPVIDRYNLTQHPSSPSNTSGRVWPEEGLYWTWQGDHPQARQALENEFSKEHSGSHQKVAIKYKYVYDQDTGRVALTKPYQYEDQHHSDLFRELGEPTGAVAAGTYNPSTGVHYMWNSDDIPKDEVERAIQKQIGSHLKEADYDNPLWKFVWADGKLAMHPDVESVWPNPGVHHYNLLQQLGYEDWFVPQNVVVGYYYPDEHDIDVREQRGVVPDTDQLLSELESKFPKVHEAAYDKAWIETSDGLRHYGPTHLDILEELQHSYQPADVVRFGGGDAAMVWNAKLPGIQQEYAEKHGSHLATMWRQVQKYVWVNGHFIVTPPQDMDDPPYHQVMLQKILKEHGESPTNYSLGYYYPDDDDIEPYADDGTVPSTEEIKQLIHENTHVSEESVHSARAKQAALHKFVWADGKFAVTPNIQHDPGLMHHGDLVEELGFGDSYGPMAQNIVAGESYAPGHIEIVYQRGEHPDEAQLAHLVQTTEPVPLYSDSPTKQAVALFPFHKYVWADGKIAVGPRVETDSVRPWHTDLMNSMGYNYQTNMPEEWTVGYYYPHDHSTYEIDSTENVPDEYSIVKQIHNHLEDGDVHAARAEEDGDRRVWIKMKDGEVFTVSGITNHIPLLQKAIAQGYTYDDIEEMGGGDYPDFWTQMVREKGKPEDVNYVKRKVFDENPYLKPASVYHPYECQAANYFFEEMDP